MTIVVTGAGGFVGRALVTQLAEAGHRVVATDRSGDEIVGAARTVIGDLSNSVVLGEVMRETCRAVVHLAIMPGGAAEADPEGARRINLDASLNLLDTLRRAGNRPRFVFASSIAVLGDPLPRDGVDDATPLAPRMIYGAQKAMIEIAAATAHRRGEIDAVTVRLPAIAARPKAPSGMKSAFISNLFHALRAGEPTICPVSAGATIWAQSLSCCVDNLAHALDLSSGLFPETRAVTLPALRIRIGELAEAIAAHCGAPRGLVSYRPEPAIEAAFGSQPPLATAAADKAGFTHDGSLRALVARGLNALEREAALV